MRVWGSRLGKRFRPSLPRRNRLTVRPSGLAEKHRQPLNSSVRLQEHFRGSARAAPASRSRFASASFLRCASDQPACVVRGRLLGLCSVRAGVRSRVHFVLGGRGASQRHHLVSGSSVARRPPPSRILAVIQVRRYRPSKVALRCRLTSHSSGRLRRRLTRALERT